MGQHDAPDRIDRAERLHGAVVGDRPDLRRDHRLQQDHREEEIAPPEGEAREREGGERAEIEPGDEGRRVEGGPHGIEERRQPSDAEHPGERRLDRRREKSEAPAHRQCTPRPARTTCTSASADETR